MIFLMTLATVSIKLVFFSIFLIDSSVLYLVSPFECHITADPYCLFPFWSLDGERRASIMEWNLEYLEKYIAFSCLHTHALFWYTLLGCFSLLSLPSTCLCCTVLPSTAKNHSNCFFFSDHLLDVHQKNSLRGINKRWQREQKFCSHLYTHPFDYPSSSDDLYLIKISVYALGSTH